MRQAMSNWQILGLPNEYRPFVQPQALNLSREHRIGCRRKLSTEMVTEERLMYGMKNKLL